MSKKPPRPPASPSPQTAGEAAMPDAPSASAIAARASLRYGFTALLVFVLGGLSLEFLHLIKAPFYLEQPLRRELWVLGHAHGALLAILNLAFAAVLPQLASAYRAGLWLRWGAALVPAGFLLGGIGNTEGDPSLMIALTPLGAAAIVIGLFLAVRAAWLNK